MTKTTIINKKTLMCILLGLVFTIPFIIYNFYIFKKPNFSNILNDPLIFENNKLKMNPTFFARNTFYIKNINNFKIKISQDGCIPSTDSMVNLEIIFEEIETLDKNWYGDNCSVRIENTNLIFHGKAAKFEKDWGEKVGQSSGKITPSFNCGISIDPALQSLKIITEMTIHYPLRSGKFSSNFSENSTLLRKGFNLIVLPKEKFISIINYLLWERRVEQLFLSAFINIGVILIITIIVFHKYK